MRLFFLLALLLPPSAKTARADEIQETKNQVKALEERLSKLEGSPAGTSLSAFNPAMGVALDLAFRHQDAKAAFLFRAAEISIEAPIDPFLKGWAVINGSNQGVEVEEAALETTSLPYNLTVRGGRLFADFGRLGHFHDHELPTIDRPRSLDTYIGGEAQGDGVEIAGLLPTDLYVKLTFGMLDRLGAENARTLPTNLRGLHDFTYTARLHTYLELNESHGFDLGASQAWTPKFSISDPNGAVDTAPLRRNTWRNLTELDLTYRYNPVRGGLYRSVVWGTEVLQNNEPRGSNPATLAPLDRVRAWGGYSYLWVKLGIRWRPGLMVDVTQDLDNARTMLRTYTAFLTYDLTEFQRLRASFARAVNNVPGMLRSDTVGVQWTGVLGHHVHGFRDR